MMWSMATILAFALALASGCFQPSHDRCSVSCAADQRCPSGMSCLADGFCHASPADSLCVINTVDAGPIDDGAVEPVCGDGIIQAELDEVCDDGDTAGGDGCDADCQEETGFVCVEEPSVCRPNPSAAGHLVITELMIDPDFAPDATAEWFEVFNPTATDFDLRGVVARDDGTETFLIDESLVLAAGAHVVLGKSANLGENGGAPVDFAYGGGFLLANMSSDEVELRIGDVLIDRVTFSTDLEDRGASRSLSADAYDAEANDVGANYCAGQGAFGDGDKGTPGQMNPDC
jgi:cysteine-rich repeat protein